MAGVEDAPRSHMKPILSQRRLGLQRTFINKINGPITERHNTLTACYYSLCVCQYYPHLWMFITSLKRDGEKEEIKMERARERELMRMIVFSQQTMSVLATTGTMLDSS